jgi:hypothetical protein
MALQTFFSILVMIFLVVTLGILAAGLISMARGSESSNRFMRFRVMSQAITVGLFVIWALLKAYS